MSYQSEKSQFLYDRFARQHDSGDLHRQVWRTVKGMPIPDDQIDMIVAAIRDGLLLRSEDRLLELACGNGALSQHLIGLCTEYEGIDISDYLIDVAKTHFENEPEVTFKCRDALSHVVEAEVPGRFTRMLCYAAFQYFPDPMIVELLNILHRRFVNIDRIFIGNLPDLQNAKAFFGDVLPGQGLLKSNETPTGIWRTQDAFRALCEAAGWRVDFGRMPAAFYASSYRYDAVLTREPEMRDE